MEYNPFLFENSGFRRIDLEPVEAMAHSLNEVAKFLKQDEFDVYGELYDELQLIAEQKLAKKVCGVHAAYCIGCDSSEIRVGEPVDSHGASFIGLFAKVTTLLAPNEAFLLPDINTQNSPVLSALFYPLEPEELQYDVGNRYSGFVSSVYPYVAVPLVGVPLIVEHLPGKVS